MRAFGKVTILTELPVVSESSGALERDPLAQCDVLMVRTRTRVTASLLDRAPRLRVIGRAGVGLENIDLEAARSRGIQVVYTPGAAADAVADLTVGLILSLVRNVLGMDRHVRSGEFDSARESAAALEMSEMTLGIVGMGRIGRAVATRCHFGFGMRILFNDIVSIGPLPFPAEEVDKPTLFRESNVVSLHVPLTDLTRELINARSLALFRAGSFLINTSRGAVVDPEALGETLRTGRLGGAALDVFEPEPIPSGHPLLNAPNTLFTPHIGARTARGLERMESVVEDVIRVLQGETPLFPAWT
jgi:D-3-phosphoglycerate dehydrogenase